MDFVETYSEAYDDAMERLVEQFRSAPKNAIADWPVIRAARLTKIWKDYAKAGVVRDEKGMADISEQMIKLVAWLEVSTMLSGHTQIDGREELDSYGYEFTDEEWDRFLDFLTAPSGQWRLSDYAFKPLGRLAQELSNAQTAEEQLLIVDQMLNVVYQRGDMAENFIEGGFKTLQHLQEQKETIREARIAGRLASQFVHRGRRKFRWHS